MKEKHFHESVTGISRFSRRITSIDRLITRMLLNDSVSKERDTV